MQSVAALRTKPIDEPSAKIDRKIGARALQEIPKKKMELIDTAYKIRCEMGACKNLASKTIKLSRVGIKSRLHVCEACLKELYSCIGASLIPPSIETAAKKREGKAK